jgi:hypothetical protein
MLKLYNRRQQIALVLFLLGFILTIVMVLTLAVMMAERYFPINDAPTLPEIVLALGGAMLAIFLSFVISLLVWLLCLKPWYRRQELEPFFWIPPPDAVPSWWRIGARWVARLFSIIYPPTNRDA